MSTKCLNLAHLSVAQEFCISPIPLNDIWPCLPPKHFGKLPDIYQVNIVRHHLWKVGVCTLQGELRSHYPVFLGVWLPSSLKNFGKFCNFLISFVVSIIRWKYEACSWWVKIYPQMGIFSLVLGPNSTKFRRADWMDFSLLANLTMFGGSNVLRKME